MPIALVDGNKVSRENLSQVLLQEKPNVSVAQYESANQAILHLSEGSDWPALIIISNNLPDSDCVDLARKIRTLAGNRLILINFVLDENDPQLVQRCFEVGDDVICAPLEQTHYLHGKISAQKRLQHRMAASELDREHLESYRQGASLEQDIIERIYHTHCCDDQSCRENIDIHNSPKALLNGDVLIAEEGPAGNVYVAIGSVSGRGLPAALGALPIFSTFRAMTKKGKPVGKIAAEMNRSLAAVLPSNMNMSLSLLELSAHCDRLSVWSGGMPDGVIVSADGSTVEKIPSKHPPLTVRSEFDFSQDVSAFDLMQGQRIFLYTDSVKRLNTVDGKVFGESEILDNINKSAKSAFENITHELSVRASHTESVLAQLVCDETKTPKSKSKEQEDLAAMPWDLNIELGADELRNINPTPQIIRLLSNALGLDVHQDFLSTILSELYNNALDHGVLGLDSQIKSGDNGFMDYYTEREKRLKSLVDGWVKINIQYFNKEIKMSVHDSGVGFDFENIKESNDLDAFGRGIEIIRSLCSKLEHSEGGSKVTVWYSIGSSD